MKAFNRTKPKKKIPRGPGMRTKKNPSNGRSFVIVAKGVCTTAKVEFRSGKIHIEREGLGACTHGRGGDTPPLASKNVSPPLGQKLAASIKCLLTYFSCAQKNIVFLFQKLSLGQKISPPLGPFLGVVQFVSHSPLPPHPSGKKSAPMCARGATFSHSALWLSLRRWGFILLRAKRLFCLLLLSSSGEREEEVT